MLTIDASVWINADSPKEKTYASSPEFLDRVAAEQITVIVPTLLRVEIAGAISRLENGDIKGRAFSRALFRLSFIRWICLDDELANAAVKWATAHRLRGADAVYAAVASEYGCSLVSLDKEHLTRLATVLAVLTPAQALAQWLKNR